MSAKAATSSVGPWLVGLAAILWATDALFRMPAIHRVDPSFVVLFEHAVGALVLFPWAFFKARRELFRLTTPQWITVMLVGVGASALATLLFTASFKYVNPSVTILLQKLQPVVVIGLAMIFLGERPRGKFYLWATISLLAGLVLSFPDFDFSFAKDVELRSRGVAYALGAAGLWAVATVMGKAMLRKLSPLVLTTWRFGFGLAFMLLIWMIRPEIWPAGLFDSPELMQSILAMSLLTGLFAMLLYYEGMKRTPASTVTIVELLFPITATALNTWVLHSPLSTVQLIAGFALLGSVTAISLENR